MKKSAFIVALLAIPAIAFAGTATLQLKLNDGTSAASFDKDTVGAQVTVAIWLNSYDDSDVGTWPGGNGVANVDGYIDASASGIFNIPSAASRTWTGPFQPSNGDLASASNLSGALSPQSKNWGIAATSQFGSGQDGNYTTADAALPWKIETITMNVVTTTPGVYTLALSTSPQSYVGSSTDTGSSIHLATELLGPVTVTITPEPATMLLLAFALPFLRRRSA